MYTEIEVSEFMIRARLHLGSLAATIKDKIAIGTDIREDVDDATELRMFLNAVNSNYQTWDLIALYKRIEYFIDRFTLSPKPLYSKDWLDKFKPVNQLIIEGAVQMTVPTGVGYLHIQNQTATLVNDLKKHITDL